MSPPLSMLLRQPLEVLEQIDGLLSRGIPCLAIADELHSQGIATSAAAVGRYRKNVWLPKVAKQKDLLLMLEIVDPADPSKSLGRVNIALAQVLLKDNLELLALDEDVTPGEAIPLVLKAMMAQDKASKAVFADVMAALKGHQLDELNKAREGDLLTLKDGRLVRVEFIEAGKPQKALPEARPKKKPAKKKQAPKKAASKKKDAGTRVAKASPVTASSKKTSERKKK